MDHIEAVKTMAAERYLLRELSNEEIDAFEDHYFDCTECSQAVLDETLVLDGGRSLVRQERRQRRSPMRMWVPLAAAGLFGAVALYTVPMAMRVPALVAQVNSYAKAEANANVLGIVGDQSAIDLEKFREQTTPILITARSTRTFLLPYGPAYRSFSQIHAQVQDSTGQIRGTVILSPDLAETSRLTLTPMRRGHYIVVIEGLSADGKKTQLRKIPFVVQ